VKALIVTDIQNDFLPGGALAVANGDAIIEVNNLLMEAFAQANQTVVCTADWHPADHVSFACNHPGSQPGQWIDLPYGKQILWPAHCVSGSFGAQFASTLKTEGASAFVRKGMRSDCDSYSGFIEADRCRHTGLASYLKEREVTEVYVTGLALDFCVSWTAMDASRLGFQTAIIEDASRAIDIDGSLSNARKEWKQLGVRVCSFAEAIDSLEMDTPDD